MHVVCDAHPGLTGGPIRRPAARPHDPLRAEGHRRRPYRRRFLVQPGALSDLELLRFVQAPRATVWRAFTDVDRFNGWFWPPSLSPLTVLDVRQGGSWRVSSSVGDMAVGGMYGEMREHGADRPDMAMGR